MAQSGAEERRSTTSAFRHVVPASSACLGKRCTGPLIADARPARVAALCVVPTHSLRRNDDPSYLLAQQYCTDANLTARIRLHDLFSTNTAPGWFAWVFEHLQRALPHRANVLEVGCGPGTFWLANAERVPTGWRATLSDFSPGMLERAQVGLPGHLNAEFRLFDVQDIPYADATFDAVIANHMLYHVPDRRHAVSEIRRVLRPGGHLFAATNGRDHMLELRELLSAHVPGVADELAPGTTFTLENGPPQLHEFFDEVAIVPYPDSLEVTNPEPIMDYIASMHLGRLVNADQLNSIRDVVANAIALRGAFHISKATGLLIAA